MLRRGIPRSNIQKKRTLKRKNASLRKKPDDGEDDALENLVLGTDEDLIKKLQWPTTTTNRKLKSTDQEEESSSGLKTKLDGGKKRKAAWEDADDQQKIIHTIEDRDVKGKKKKLALRKKDYKKHLDSKFISVYGTPAWATLDKEGGSRKKTAHSDDDEILRHVGDYLDVKSEYLPKRLIDVERVCDLNFSTKVEGKNVGIVEFHPTATVAVVAGSSGVSSLIQVDGKTNPKIQTVKFNKFRINAAHFSADGQQLIVGSLFTREFYYYDMIAGKIVRVPSIRANEKCNMGTFSVSPDGQFLAFHGPLGNIYLLSAKTKEWVGTVKMNQDVKALAFNKDGSKLYSHGDGGEVYVWDMGTRTCVHRFHDDGCVDGTALAISASSRYLACGSSSGVVNIYDSCNLSSTTPKPTKILLNLTTSVSKVKFNHNTEVMVMASDCKDNAIKLVHVPSMTTFANFPALHLNMKKPLCADFSLNSGYLTVSNNFGTVYLYRLKHYGHF